jgi:hypothetical protein
VCVVAIRALVPVFPALLWYGSADCVDPRAR